MVAAVRAATRRRADPIIDDPFAEPLVRAVGIEFFSRVASGDLDLADVGGDRQSAWMTDLFAVRTRFFDSHFTTAWQQGIRQAVIIGSGLDSRAYRMPWPSGSVVYELDLPSVVDFKTATMAGLDAAPLAEVRTVGVDLRKDWPTALRANGFDPQRPTAWLAEGLMIGFLPAGAQDRLLDLITTESCSGSVLAADYSPGDAEMLGEQMRNIDRSWRQHGPTVDLSNLYYAEERTDVAEYLRSLGWRTKRASATDLFGAARVPVPATLGDGASAVTYLTAARI
jgi:methyltransferase (TIGR00027 family)